MNQEQQTYTAFAGTRRIASGELAQVVSNIVDNAFLAMPEGGRLSIRGAQADGYIELRFADTGGGIPEEILGKVFDPFFTTREVGEGFGLGLATSYEIIKRHGGEIVAGNDGPGALFTVRLPLNGQTGQSLQEGNTD